MIFSYHKKFNPSETADIESGCRGGTLGCVDCKLRVAVKISDYLAPIREKRNYYESHQLEVIEMLKSGEEKAKMVALRTMSEVRSAMKLG